MMTASGSAQAAPAEVRLWRLDCGQIRVDDLNALSRTRERGEFREREEL
jgi:predicted aspartyl protease